MRTGVFVQARMRSTRLEFKMFKTLTSDYKSLLEVNLLASKKIKADEYVLLIPRKDSPWLKKIGEDYGFKIFEGSEKDVFSRFIGAANKFDIDRVVRVCGDKPVIAYKYVNELLDIESLYDIMFYRDEPLKSTTAGIYSANIMKRIHEKIKNEETDKKDFYLEHVKPYFIEHAEQFTYFIKENPEHLRERKIDLSIDTEEELDKIREIFYNLYKGEPLTVEEVIKYLDDNDKQT